MNKVTLIGRIGKIESKSFDWGKVLDISLATDESYKDKDGNKVEKTEWHNVVFQGKIAEVVERYVNKGDRFCVEGKLKTRSWEKDGEKRYVTEVVGTGFEFVQDKKDQANRNGSETEPLTKNSQRYDEEPDLPF